jgi:hypothetical protein
MYIAPSSFHPARTKAGPLRQGVRKPWFLGAIESYGDGARHVKKTGGPTKPTISPSATEKEIPSTTAEFPNLFARAFTSSMAALHANRINYALKITRTVE